MASSDDSRYSPGGSKILRYETVQDYEAPEHTAVYFDEIEGHIERHIGAVDVVYHETAIENLQIDIMVVPANSDRRFHYLVTSGMSDLPMHINSEIKDADSWRHAELVMALPAWWPVLDEAAMLTDRWGYPVEHLKFLARIPQRFNSWLSVGHSIPNGNPVDMIGPKCSMTGFVLDYPVLGGESFTKLKTRDGKTVRFYAVYPVYEDEMEHKLKKGYPSLRKIFSDKHVMEIFDPYRPSVLPSGWRRYIQW